MHIAFFYIKVRSLMFSSCLLPSSFQWNGLSLSFQTSGKHKCISTDVTSTNILPSGLLLQVYSTLSCLRQKSSWFFLCLCSLSHLQAVPILDPVAKVFSPSFTTHFLPSYNRAHHLIRDVNSCKESFSHMYFLFQEASLKIQNKQCVHLQWVLLDLSGITQNCVSIFQTASKNTLEGTIAKWSLYLTLSYVSALCILQKAFQELGSRNGQWVCTLAWPYCHGTNQCSTSHMCLADFVKWFI